MVPPDDRKSALGRTYLRVCGETSNSNIDRRPRKSFSGNINYNIRTKFSNWFITISDLSAAQCMETVTKKELAWLKLHAKPRYP